jgi:N-ATPase, AtpR subunit
MSLPGLMPMLAVPGAALAVGVGLGLAYFAALRWTVSLYAAGSGWRVPTMLTLGRIGAGAAILGLAARFGALPLLAAFLGFLIARGIALRAARRAA